MALKGEGNKFKLVNMSVLLGVDLRMELLKDGAKGTKTTRESKMMRTVETILT